STGCAIKTRPSVLRRTCPTRVRSCSGPLTLPMRVRRSSRHAEDAARSLATTAAPAPAPSGPGLSAPQAPTPHRSSQATTAAKRLGSPADIRLVLGKNRPNDLGKSVMRRWGDTPAVDDDHRGAIHVKR